MTREQFENLKVRDRVTLRKDIAVNDVISDMTLLPRMIFPGKRIVRRVYPYGIIVLKNHGATWYYAYEMLEVAK